MAGTPAAEGPSGRRSGAPPGSRSRRRYGGEFRRDGPELADAPAGLVVAGAERAMASLLRGYGGGRASATPSDWRTHGIAANLTSSPR
jgi:hypothetical protein